jgi:hypothetical protein
MRITLPRPNFEARSRISIITNQLPDREGQHMYVVDFGQRIDSDHGTVKSEHCRIVYYRSSLQRAHVVNVTPLLPDEA